MKFLIFFTILLLSLVYANAEIDWTPGDYPAQTVNHFGASNSGKWNQRYETANFKTYKDGGPLFFFLAGEAPMEFFRFQEVFGVSEAEKYGALWLSLEHRYYGKSFPSSDLATHNLTQLLSSQQALEDAVQFIDWFVKFKLKSPPSKVIVWGCSYSGALSAWMRALYPNVVAASVAPSGPEQAQIDFTSYMDLYETVVSKDCASSTKEGFSEIRNMLLNGGSAGEKKIEELFNTCDQIDTPDKKFFFLWSVSTAVGSVIQMSNPPDWTAHKSCNIMTNSSQSDPMLRFVDAFNFINSGSEAGTHTNVEALNHLRRIQFNQKEGNCNSFSEQEFIDEVKKTSQEDSQVNERAWFFQKCNEFGYFKPTNASSIWGSTISLERMVGWCEQMFGISGMTPHTQATNAQYGGKYKYHGHNVISTDGFFDPWHLLSITTETKNVEVAMYDAGHCAPMIASTKIDPPSLTQARAKVDNFLAGQFH